MSSVRGSWKELCVQSTELLSSLWWQTLSYMALIRAIYDRVMILSVALCTELTVMIHRVALCTEHRALIITVMTDSVSHRDIYWISYIHRNIITVMTENLVYRISYTALCTEHRALIITVMTDSVIYGSYHVSFFQWVMSLLPMSHVSLTNESCLSYQWVMSLLSMSHVSLIHESCVSYPFVMFHIYIGSKLALSHLSMSHVSLIHESCLSHHHCVSSLWW